MKLLRAGLRGRAIYWSFACMSLPMLTAKSASADAEHDCCGDVHDACQARPDNLPTECRAGARTHLECDFLCCLAHALIFDSCPGIIGCPGGDDHCPCVPTLPDAQCVDTDGDGLLDDWEINGLDEDGDGVVDLNLPAWGANPNHKDLFLELDWMVGQNTTRASIQAMKAAFAAAPINAGGTSNPDGRPGINIWIDTGTLSDPTASEGGMGGNTCGDGVDNDGNGLADGADPTCLVGDNLGGGNSIPASSVCGLTSAFYTLKGANFNALRQRVFRYGISASNGGCMPATGGQGEIGGNDFVEFNHDGGTIMHEFGHTLNLHHGGDVDNNCKPNYVSVMNYDQQFGINQVGGGTILDYSPPRFAGGRGAAPLASLLENSLDESRSLDSTDAVNRFVFVNSVGQKVQSTLSLPVAWDGNPAGDVDPPFESGLTVNIDTAGANGRPTACQNTATNSTLTGADDWSRIALAFSQFADSSTGAIHPELQPEPTLQDRAALIVELNTTDLSVTATSLPNPVAAGDIVTYSVLVRNGGPNPASDVLVSDPLPVGLSYIGNTGGCIFYAGNLTCNFGEIIAGQTQGFSVVARVDPAYVYQHPAPVFIQNLASVSHTKGPDLAPANDVATDNTSIIASADLAVVGFVPISPPAQGLIGQPVPIAFKKTITQTGPSSPFDVRLLPAVLAPPGATAHADATGILQSALLNGERRDVTESFTVTCGGAGDRTFTFQNSIEPANALDRDPNLTNNHVEGNLTLRCITPIAMSITPTTVDRRQRVVVAVLTTSAGEYGLPVAFDATRVDAASVRFGSRDAIWNGTGGAHPDQGRGYLGAGFEPVDGHKDSDPDMIFVFNMPDTGIGPAATEACVKGDWLDTGGARYSFFGCAAITIQH